MRIRIAAFAAVSTVALLAGCATQPLGPTIPAMPPQGKSMDAFEQDESYCEQYANDRASGRVKQADDKELRNGAVGAALGAGLGALAGNTKGAIAGGIIGGVLGGASGSGWDQAHIQRVYDISYAQCMKAKGNEVPMGHPRRWRRDEYYGAPPTPMPPPPPPGN
jgi:uncharacterized protein YcfJ